jgi:hypothetical protein
MAAHVDALANFFGNNGLPGLILLAAVLALWLIFGGAGGGVVEIRIRSRANKLRKK